MFQEVRFNHEAGTIYEAVGITKEDLDRAVKELGDNFREFMEDRKKFEQWVLNGNTLVKLSGIVAIMQLVFDKLSERGVINLSDVEVAVVAYLGAFHDVFERASRIVEFFWNQLPDCERLYMFFRCVGTGILSLASEMFAGKFGEWVKCSGVN